MGLNKNRYRNDSARLKNWDYSSPGYYAVTICTKNRKRYFGEVVIPWEGSCIGIAGTHDHASLPPSTRPAHDASHAVMRLTSIGKIAHQNWIDIPKHFPFIIPDEFVVMPDHIHGILCFQKPGYRGHILNTFGPQSKNLASVIRGYKAATKAYATRHCIEFGWHHRYYDDVITSGVELENMRRYFRNNPAKWIEKQ